MKLKIFLFIFLLTSCNKAVKAEFPKIVYVQGSNAEIFKDTAGGRFKGILMENYPLIVDMELVGENKQIFYRLFETSEDDKGTRRYILKANTTDSPIVKSSKLINGSFPIVYYFYEPFEYSLYDILKEKEIAYKDHYKIPHPKFSMILYGDKEIIMHKSQKKSLSSKPLDFIFISNDFQGTYRVSENLFEVTFRLKYTEEYSHTISIPKVGKPLETPFMVKCKIEKKEITECTYDGKRFLAKRTKYKMLGL